MEYSGKLNLENFQKVKRRWSIAALIADPLMHLGAFFAIYLMILGGFHIPDFFSIHGFWASIGAFIAVFFAGLHILGTVFPDHYIRQKPLNYSGVFIGIAMYFIGLTGIFFVFVSALPAFALAMWALFYILFWMNILGITIGYHRLFTHRAFSCGKNFMRGLLGAGASARQNDCDKWGRNHLIHHERTEIVAQDPHTPHESFFHAHIGWIWYAYIYPPEIWEHKQFSRGLKDNALVQEQKKYYTHVMLGSFIGPFLGFFLWSLWSGGELSLWHSLGEGFKAFLLCGLLRFVICYHITLSVNSWSHKFGPKPFININREGWDKTGDSTDPWYLAFFSSGENLQNIHHLMDFLACYWVDRWHPDFSGAIIVALERIGRFKLLSKLGLPYDVNTIDSLNRLKFLQKNTVLAYQKMYKGGAL